MMATVASDLLKALPSLLPSCKVLGMVRGQQDGRRGGQVHVTIDVLTPLGRKRRLVVEARATAVPSRVRETLRQLKATVGSSAAYPVFASTFLSLRVRDICREEGVGYLDLAGNGWLRFDDFYLEKVVDRNPFPVRGRPPSLFSPVSSRIVRALLEEPGRAWQVSELVLAAEVSLGHASNVTRRLIEQDYAARNGRRLSLTRPAQLLDAWRDHGTPVPETQAGYYSFEQNPARLLQRVAAVGRERQRRYAVTSFAAASLVAPFVHGIGIIQWYIEDAAQLEAWVQALDLRPVESGPNVALRVPQDQGVFYRSRAVDGVALVGDIQLYLDLCREPGRGREQAEFLRKERLRFS